MAIPEFTKNVWRGRQLVKEIFRQPVKTLLTDNRTVRVCQHWSVFRQWQTEDEILAWIGENIGDEHDPFVIEDEDDGGS